MHEFPVIEWAGLRLEIATILTIVVTCIIVLWIAIAATRKLSVNQPSKSQNFIEWVVDFVHNIIGSSMDRERGKPFLALGVTLILFIFVGNMLGLPFSIQTVHTEPMEIIGITEEDVAHGHGAHVAWTKSPTADASVTMALAIMVFVIVHVNALRQNPKYYFKHYLEPYPVFLPLNLIKQLSKPITHGMRLYGNIFAGEVLIGVLIGAGAFGIIPLVAWQGFSIFVGSIQSFIFVVLTMVYISLELKHEH